MYFYFSPHSDEHLGTLFLVPIVRFVHCPPYCFWTQFYLIPFIFFLVIFSYFFGSNNYLGAGHCLDLSCWGSSTCNAFSWQPFNLQSSIRIGVGPFYFFGLILLACLVLLISALSCLLIGCGSHFLLLVISA